MKLSLYCGTISSMITFGFVPIRSSVSAHLETTTSVSFRPYVISYGTLMDDSIYQDKDSGAYKSLEDALYTVGMVTITDVFKDVTGVDEESVSDDSKRQTFGSLFQCTMDSNTSKVQTYHDATIVRNTLAAVTIPSQNLQKPVIATTTVDHLRSSCDVFSSSSSIFRSKVTEVTNVLVKRLLMLLSGIVDDNVHETIRDVLSNGEHLEHFRSYQYNQQHMKSSAPTYQIYDDVDEESTIHWHTDQGLFLMFTPARTVQPSQTSNTTHLIESHVMKDGLYVKLLDGTIARVDFNENDDLVFMLGDGFNQYINPRLDSNLFRATPHALMIQPSTNAFSEDEVRVWYGRMVFPPNDAIHPHTGHNKATFGELRNRMIDATLDHLSSSDGNNGSMGPLLSIGCSSGYAARDLAAAECARGTTYCWHGCAKYPTLKPLSCALQFKVLGCGSKGKWWDGSHGAQWVPTCLNRKTKPDGYPFNS